MTCSKCERLISEAVLEAEVGASKVDIDRPNSKAQIFVESGDAELASTKEKLLNIINTIVNGKFNASYIEGA